MDGRLYFEDLHIGDRWETSGRTVTETDVVNFAGVTGDYDPLHVDHQYASRSAFRAPVAHGLLGLSLAAGLASHFPHASTDAFVGVRNWMFHRPIFFGDTVRVVNEVVDLAAGGRRRGRVVWKRQLVNQHGQIVQEGLFETLVAVRQAPASTGLRPDPIAGDRAAA